jgi:hypothetical protein
MAEFCYYAVEEDALEWLEGLAKLRRFKFILGTAYDQPQAYEFTEFNEAARTHLTQCYSKCYSVCLWSEEYSRLPVVFRKQTSTDEGQKYDWYRLPDGLGGPMIELGLPKKSKRWGNAWRISPTELRYLPYYGNDAGDQWFKSPPEIVKAFRDIRKLLQKQLVKRYATFQIRRNGELNDIENPVWIGRQALLLMESGEAEWPGPGSESPTRS